MMANLRLSRRSGQSELKSWVHLTEGIAHFVTWMVANCWINWHLTVAKCTVPSGLSHRLCCNNRAVRIIESVLLAVSVAPKGILLMLQSVTPHSHITVSPATCHPVQCSPNMRVAGCATVWVCKCLQLIYLHALPLTLVAVTLHSHITLQSITSNLSSSTM